MVIGNGFFKPNISTMVGSLYAEGDRRRDAGFTIFYMGINLGSLFSQIFCPLLAVGMGSWGGLGWWAGFGLAAAGMLVPWLADPVRWRQARRATANGPTRRPRPIATMLIYARRHPRHPGGLLPVHQFDESTLDPNAGSGFVGYLAYLPIMGKMHVRHVPRSPFRES